MTSIKVKASRQYRVEIGRALLPTLGEQVRVTLPKSRQSVIVTDSNIAPLYLQTASQSLQAMGLKVSSFVFPAGESSKNGETYFALLEHLAKEQIGRSDVLVALGGGVVGDLCGFAAATYLRGISFVQVPTTLLAAVDSSVGGKTAIDLKAGKNLAGAFYQPNLVLCDLDCFQTLSPEVFSDGCAEVIKYGMLGSAKLLAILSNQDIHDQLEEVVSRCVEMKRDIVERDEFESGDRMLLNFGHTFGHAIEACSHYEISHGQAVAVGMAIMTRAAVHKGLCPPECLTVLVHLLDRFHLPQGTDFPVDALYTATLSDKKRESERMTLIVPTKLGLCKRESVALRDLPNWIETGYAP